MTDDNTAPFTPEHAEFLTSQAVDIKLAAALGVRSVTSSDDMVGLPEVWPNWANFPSLLFPWTSPDGRVEYQVRADNPTDDTRGRPRKYVFRKGMMPVLWAVREVPGSERMAIVEGTKQCLAAASYAPPGVSIYGIAGCRSWQVDGVPIPDLAIADGREVVVILDVDAGTNPEVYQAGIELEKALVLEGATKVLFTRLPGGDKSGLDDVLGGRPAVGRAGFLKRLIDGAKAKPADRLPKGKGKKNEAPTSDDGRVTIVINRDRLAVINDLTDAMLKRWDAVRLFNHGGILSWRTDTGMKPVDRGSFHDLIQVTAITVTENETANGTTYGYGWPDPGSMAATLSRSDRFAALDRISRAPFVREDGTVVTEPGYDEATRTMLIPDPVFEGLKVPETPTADEIAAARELLLTEWFGDFPFDSDTDRANVLALIVTPAIRGMVPKVPMAVIDGLQMGVGKNLLADSLLTAYTGQAAEPMNWVPEADELRKQITAAFRTGAEFFVFDEAHTVEGAPLAQALTAATWQDRILGVSNMANFPNTITWVSLGNNVQVRGDLTRRVYRIALRPTYANPQDRPSDSFRHPGQSGLDLGSWTRKNRRELMIAILTLVRAWFAAGSPRPARGVSFGSFEIWEKIVGGIVETAGCAGFLDNLKIWRSESDFDTQYWAGHLGWLRDTFGSKPFRTAEVKAQAQADMSGYLAPPNLDDLTDKAYGKRLGEAYSRLRGRRYGTLWIERNGTAHGHVSVWVVNDSTENPPTKENPTPMPTPPPVTPDPQPVDNPVDETRLDDLIIETPDSEMSVEDVDCNSIRHAPDCSERCGIGQPRLPGPAPYNEHAEARGAAPEDLTGDSGEVRPPLQDADTLTFDLETGDADDLYRTDPAEYVRIGATAADDGEVVAYDSIVPHEVAEDIRRANTVTGHNIMAFDLPALVRSGALTMPEVHRMAAEGRLFDGLLVARYLDPPMARAKGVDHQRKYDLGTLAAKHGFAEKLSDVSKALAKKYGGWGAIPIDDSEDGRAFKEYMCRDVEISRHLHAALLAELNGTMPDYLLREHRVAAIAAQISINGFLVDIPLLEQRVSDIQERKAEAMQWLAAECGIPTADAKGKAYLSPLSTKAGKAALDAALRAAGVTSLWTTPASGEIQVSSDHMLHIGRECHHLPKAVEIAKQVYKIVSARTVYETIQGSLCPDGRVHPKISFEQATGRWSLTKPGLTVLGKRGGRHVERAVLLPDPGEVILAADLSQVDMRAVAGLSQDQAYIQMLKRDDPHTELAVALFGDAGHREVAKAIGHGWNYGESLKRISQDNEIDPILVNRFDQSMRDRFPRLVEWRDEVRELGASGALLDNGFGRKMRPEPARSHTQSPALMGQGCARDLMAEGMIRLPAEILPMLRAQVHDEIVLSVPADQAEEVGRAVVEALSFEWNNVPITADVSRPGSTWAEVYEKP